MTPKGIEERFFTRTVVFSVSCLLLLSGCVNLPNRTTKTKADMVKSPDAMKKFSELKGDKFVTKVKKAIPGLSRSKQTIKPTKLAKDDPTRLDYMPKSIGPSVYLSAARMAEQNGRPDVAREQYQKILKKDRTNRNAIIGLARLYYRGGDLKNAERLYREGLSMYRNDAVIMNDLGLCYARKGQLNESIAMLQAALQVSPGRKMYINNLGAALVEANRNKEAVAYLTQAHGADQANLQVGYMLGEAGRQDLAMEFLGNALAINPNLQAARDLMDGQVSRVSSLPARGGSYSVPSGTQQKQKPIVTPVNPLSDSKSYRAKGQFGSITPAELPADVSRDAERIGPYGFVPQRDVSEVQVVSYVEDVE